MDWQKQPGHGGPPKPPDLSEFLNKLKSQFDFDFLKKGGTAFFILIPLVAFLLYNSYYIVQPQEVAVVQRFGAYNRTTGPGLHFKIPFGIEKVNKVPTGRVFQMEFGYRTKQAGVRSRFIEKGFEEESRMLTGDLNIIDLQWTVQYKINNPVEWLFKVADVDATIYDVSESVMRRIVGNRYSDYVLTVGRAEIADAVKQEMQKILNTYQTGIKIITVKLQNANPPGPVKDAFNEVNEARQEKERMINEAQAAYNKEIPKAIGQAKQSIAEAEGYALQRINRAKGESERFLSVLKEYKQYEDVTRRRFYLEAYQEFLKRIKNIYVVDSEQKTLVPFMDVGKGTGAGVFKGMNRIGAPNEK